METETIFDEYRNVTFPKDVINMFARIVSNDKWTLTVFKYIAQRYKDEGQHFQGVTVNEISENVEIERKVKTKKGRKFVFEQQRTFIHRQTAGIIVDKLMHMSLLSCRPLTPYKYYFITQRGIQVLQEIVQIHKQSNEKGAEING